jgi:hypothetical protein
MKSPIIIIVIKESKIHIKLTDIKLCDKEELVAIF